MGRKRIENSGCSSCVCDMCGAKNPSTVKLTKHRRCGGVKDAAARPKHSIVSKRGTWR